MEKVVDDAKAEVEASMSAALRRVGLDAVAEDPNRLAQQLRGKLDVKALPEGDTVLQITKDG
jgi:hypothetical protein